MSHGMNPNSEEGLPWFARVVVVVVVLVLLLLFVPGQL